MWLIMSVSALKRFFESGKGAMLEYYEGESDDAFKDDYQTNAFSASQKNEPCAGEFEKALMRSF